MSRTIVNSSDGLNSWDIEQSTSTATNTGTVETVITGVNESVAFRQDIRTNLITYSEDFSDASWTNQDIGTTPVLTSGFTSPDGTNSAYKISNSSQDSFFGNLSISGASDYRTIYARTVSGIGTAQLLTHNSNTNNTFNLTEEWQRFEISSTTSVVGDTNFYTVDFRGGGNLTELLIWGAQLEEASQATSYIYTNGTAVTVDSNSTSVVNNTGIVERPITGVSDGLNSWDIEQSTGTTNSTTTIRYINPPTIIPNLLSLLQARATYYENVTCTTAILTELETIEI